jgi:hypothetical protein
MEKIVIGLISLLVVCLIVITAVIPSSSSAIGAVASAGTVINEVFAGINGSYSNLARYALNITSYQKALYEYQSNVTALAANGSRIVTTNTDFYNGLPTNFTYCWANVNSTNATITLNGAVLGYVPLGSTACGTYVSVAGVVAGDNTVTVTAYNNSIALSIINATLYYPYWNTTLGYTLSGGDIAPTSTGTFRVSYAYGAPNDVSTQAILLLIPLLLAVALVVIILAWAKLSG